MTSDSPTVMPARSRLSNLIDRARAFVKRKTATDADDAVPASSLDRLVYDELLKDAPALSDLARRLQKKHAFAEDLVRDTVMQFYQYKPTVRAKAEMDPRRLHNWAVAQGIAEAPDTAKARQYTRQDKYAAAMLALATAGRLEELLEQNEEIEEAAEQVDAAQAGLDQANKGLQEAADAAAGAETQMEAAVAAGDDEAQAAAEVACQGASTALGQALAKAENAQQLVEAAEFTAEQAAEHARVQLQAAVGDGVEEGTEQLEQEQELARAWGQDDGVVKSWSFAEREAAMRMMRDSAISQYAQLLGRFQYAERSAYAKKVVPGREEVWNVTKSGSLRDALRSELVALATPELELEFLDRWSRSQLLSRSYRGTEKVGNGAIIMCVDTSDSMNWRKSGQPVTAAVYSKALLLALLRRAKRDKRDFVAILFSSRNQVEVHRFPKGQATLEQMVAVVTRAFNGGTDFEAPLTAAVDILEAEFNAEGRRKGDVVFVTDDDCAVSPDWLDGYRKRRQTLGFRTWGVAVPKTTVGSALTSISDHVRAISEFTSPSPVQDLLKAV